MDRYSFGAARFDPSGDRIFLGWVFSQFLYGEVTGIQCGTWLYRAPSLEAAIFIARQATEELSHVRRMKKILDLLGCSPEKVHRGIRFLSTGMMSGSWGEHVCIEMAIGEGLVLEVFHALEETIDHPEIQAILRSVIPEEIRHAEFGERETLRWLQRHPSDRRWFETQWAVQVTVLRLMRLWLRRRMGSRKSHAVWSQLDLFLDFVFRKMDLRVGRLGIARRNWSEASPVALAVRVSWGLVLAPLEKVRMWSRRPRLLTDSYMEDPWIKTTERA